MVPYVWQQLEYAALSLLLTALVWWAFGTRLAARPLARVLATGLTLAFLGGLGVALVRWVDDSHSTWQFIAIAFLFYAAVLWLPACLAVDELRRRRRGGPSTRWARALALAGFLLGLQSLFHEPNRLQVTRHSVAIEAWPAGAAPLRIVHLSDLQTVGPNARQRRAAELVRSLQPDLIVITGDFIAGPFRDPEPAIAAAREFLGALAAPLGVIAVTGHSEPPRLVPRILAGLGIRVLDHEELTLELTGAPPRRLRILGVPAYDVDLGRLARRSEPGLASLFVSHVPDLTRELDRLGIDLHLAGHTHGGQVSLPFLGPPMILSDLPRSMARGLHRVGEHWLHVSPGIGMEGNHAPRFRFLCPPELSLILLEGTGSEPLR